MNIIEGSIYVTSFNVHIFSPQKADIFSHKSLQADQWVKLCKALQIYISTDK